LTADASKPGGAVQGHDISAPLSQYWKTIDPTTLVEGYVNWNKLLEVADGTEVEIVTDRFCRVNAFTAEFLKIIVFADSIIRIRNAPASQLAFKGIDFNLAMSIII